MDIQFLVQFLFFSGKISEKPKKPVYDHYGLIFIFSLKIHSNKFFYFFFQKSIGKIKIGQDFSCPKYDSPKYFSFFFVIEEKKYYIRFLNNTIYDVIIYVVKKYN